MQRKGSQYVSTSHVILWIKHVCCHLANWTGLFKYKIYSALMSKSKKSGAKIEKVSILETVCLLNLDWKFQ